MHLTSPVTTKGFELTSRQSNLASFSTESCFWWHYEKNSDPTTSTRGKVNYEYNRLLAERDLIWDLIPGGEDLDQLGMDRKTTVVRPDLYRDACQKVMSDEAEVAARYYCCGPFRYADIFSNAFKFMRYGDIFLCARVCKHWNAFCTSLNWKQFFKDEKIPFVEPIEGQLNDYKQEFRILYPMTIGGESERLFGKFYKEIPCISRKIFEDFFKIDPFEPGKLIMHTFKVVVFPDSFERTSCEEFPYILDQNGDLQPVKFGEWTEEKLQIPNGIRNLQILCEYPLAGKENMPVLCYIHPDILGQCSTYSDKISLFLMRTCIAGGSKNMPYPKQKAFVEDRGFNVTPLRVRVFFEAFSILTSGTCPYDKDFWGYARTADTIVIGQNDYQSFIGGFVPGVGVNVQYNSYVNDAFGVVPGISAELPGK